jgi:hypothetical protein
MRLFRALFPLAVLSLAQGRPGIGCGELPHPSWNRSSESSRPRLPPSSNIGKLRENLNSSDLAKVPGLDMKKLKPIQQRIVF